MIMNQELEEKPDKWFATPKGFLSKPSFSRAQQDREHVEKEKADISKKVGGAFSGLKAMVKGSVSSTYQKRFFKLNIERRFLTYYKDDQPGTVESGFIDISNILDVQLSQISDAPPFSIDLVSIDKYYTLAADSEAQMVRWAYALNGCRPQVSKIPLDPKNKREDQLVANYSNKEKWTRFEHTYVQKGPLMLNVMGTLNKDSKTGKVISNWIIVTSFEPTFDGKPGRSEATGLISVKDYLVAVNGLDLMKYTFNESMEIINKSTFPKTIQFLRDNSGGRQQSRAEGWAVVFYPSLNKKRRRYVDVRWDCINFRKPAPGGSANAERESFITLDKIESMKPIVDKTMPIDQQYILRLVCKAGAFIDHVGHDDTSLGTSDVEFVDLCFAKDSQMKNWRSVLVSPSIYNFGGSSPTITVHDVEVIESSSLETLRETNLAIKSDLTSQFAQREFTLIKGNLQWVRVGQKSHTSRPRSLELVTTTSCNLKSVKAVEVPKQMNIAYRYQLILEVNDQTITMGMRYELVKL